MAARRISLECLCTQRINVPQASTVFNVAGASKADLSAETAFLDEVT
jgi:hypothetical protein